MYEGSFVENAQPTIECAERTVLDIEADERYGENQQTFELLKGKTKINKSHTFYKG